MATVKALERQLRLAKRRTSNAWKRVVRAEHVHDRYEAEEHALRQKLVAKQLGITEGQVVIYEFQRYTVEIDGNSGEVRLARDGGRRPRPAPALRAFIDKKSVSPFVQRTVDEQNAMRKAARAAVVYKTTFCESTYRVRHGMTALGSKEFIVERRDDNVFRGGYHIVAIRETKKSAVGWLGARKRRVMDRERARTQA